MVRFTYKYFKPIPLILAIAFLFQCCKVYHRETVSIVEAVGPGKEGIKIITNDDRKFYFNSIYYIDDGLLYEITSNKIYDTLETKIIVEKIKEQKTVSYTGVTSEEIKTFDGEKYVFNSYYYKNNTFLVLNDTIP